MAISDDFSASVDVLAVVGETPDSTTTASRDAAGSILINGGEVPVVCGQLTGPSLIQTKAEIDVDRKHVTVLSVEIVSPLHAFASMDPELVLRQIDPLLESTFEIIELNGGVISTSGESGITAIFGTLPASQHHALSACQAALVVKSTLELQAEGGIRVRAGLDTGEVIVRYRRRGATKQIEVTGGAVRGAARLARSLRRGAVAVTDRTRVATDGSLNMVRLSRSDLIRFDRDEQAYELKSTGSTELSKRVTS
jgi:class 3 adenylate cyclase